MKLGIIIYSNDPESVWNAFRLGNYAIKEGDEVKAFLSGKGVESESIDTKAFNVTEQMRASLRVAAPCLPVAPASKSANPRVRKRVQCQPLQICTK